MATERRIISIPPALAARLDREAKDRNVTFSALVVELLRRHDEPPGYMAIIDDDPALSLKVEEILAR